MADRNQRAVTGVSRLVIFQAWCSRGGCRLGPWRGQEHDQRQFAEMERAAHEVTVHGGASTRDEEATE